MAENVNTGGTIKFHYSKDYNPQFTKEEKQEIRDAYNQYYERKRKENRDKIIIYSAIVIIILLSAAYFIFR